MEVVTAVEVNRVDKFKSFGSHLQSLHTHQTSTDALCGQKPTFALAGDSLRL
jgi:hypothetical protein